jgi:tRNA (cytidine/uridine-2'-O-)-methyltransferase
VATNCELHLIEPLAFKIDDKQLKRAGLDYWPHLKWYQHPNYEGWFNQVKDPSRIFFFTTKVQKTYFQVRYQPGDWLVFGKETKGLSPEIIQKFPEQAVTIPQWGPVRSLNLATAVAIASYEGVRQLVESSPS